MRITSYQVVNLIHVQLKIKPGMVTHTCNLSTQGTGAGIRLIEVQPGLHSKF